MPADQAGPLARYAATIQSQRGDYNGKVLSIRHEDLRSLAVIYDESPIAAHRTAHHWGVLGADARAPWKSSCSFLHLHGREPQHRGGAAVPFCLAAIRSDELRLEFENP